jgi:retron-type reverse transcriptase
VPVVASAAPAGIEELDAVRALQHALYRAAKADPGRRFHALYDKLSRRDVLQRAWEQVRRNRGAPGIDQVTIAQVEQYGVDRLLDKLAVVLESGSYRPVAARRVLIPKPGSTEQRPLSIPTVADRIVQAAMRIVLEPIFEADMLDCSFGFRPRRAAHDALQVVIDQSWQGRRWVVETDIADCFSAIPHSGLVSAVKERVCDRRLLKLLGAFLRSGVLEDGAVRRPVSGTPQGGVLSPVLCNVYLHTGWTGPGGARTGRWCATRMICWWSAGPVGRPGPRWRGFGRCWPASAWSRRRPRRGSCTWSRAVRGSTSWASTIGWCAPARSVGPAGWSTLPAGLLARRRSTPGTASGS